MVETHTLDFQQLHSQSFAIKNFIGLNIMTQGK